MKYEASITVPAAIARKIHEYLTKNPGSRKDCLDHTITYTAVFADGKQMDVKCCPVDYDEDGVCTAWSEVVLFNEKGGEIVCDLTEHFFGDWALFDGDGNEYVAHVKAEDGARPYFVRLCVSGSFMPAVMAPDIETAKRMAVEAWADTDFGPLSGIEAEVVSVEDAEGTFVFE